MSIDLSPAPSAVMLLECCAFCSNFWPTCRVVLAMSAPLQGNCELTPDEQVLVDGFRFRCPPTGGHDTWEIVGNFLIRNHARARKVAFHPLHGSNPVEPSQLTDQRLTILFKINNSTWTPELRKDVWRVAKQPSLALSSWKGFTIFTKLQQQDSTARSSQEHFNGDELWLNWHPTTSELRRHPKKDSNIPQGDSFPSSADCSQERGPDGNPSASWFPTTSTKHRPEQQHPKEDSNIPKGDDCPSYSERGPDGQYDPERIIEYFDC